MAEPLIAGISADGIGGITLRSPPATRHKCLLPRPSILISLRDKIWEFPSIAITDPVTCEPRAVDKVVAQTASLLYRRLPACGVSIGADVLELAMRCRLAVGDTAGWQPALRANSRTLSLR